MSYGRGGAWRQMWECLKSRGGQRSHNKPIRCSASGAYAPGPDDDHTQQLQRYVLPRIHLLNHSNQNQQNTLHF